TTREQYDREHTTIEKANPLEKTELESIVERAKPELPSEAIEALEKIEKYLKNGENNPSDAEYIDSLKGLLGIMSPENKKQYENYSIKFVPNDNVSQPIPREDKTGKRIDMPTKYEYPIQGMILHCFDELLRIEVEEVDHIMQNS